MDLFKSLLSYVGVSLDDMSILGTPLVAWLSQALSFAVASAWYALPLWAVLRYTSTCGADYWELWRLLGLYHVVRYWVWNGKYVK